MSELPMSEQTIQVSVSGPGGTFGDVIYILHQALEAAGATVSVEDEHPPGMSDEKLRELVKGRHIKITAIHHPWGG